jgi:hypothetical protein
VQATGYPKKSDLPAGLESRFGRKLWLCDFYRAGSTVPEKLQNLKNFLQAGDPHGRFQRGFMNRTA